MGFGLPAAIGAKIANPDKDVVSISGDGGLQMNIQELATSVVQGAGVTICVLNNYYLGMVRQMQQLFYGKRYSYTVLNDKVDFVKVAEGMGAKAMRITKKEEVEPAIREAIAAKCPVVLDCVIDCDDKVFPMVSPG